MGQVASATTQAKIQAPPNPAVEQPAPQQQAPKPAPEAGMNPQELMMLLMLGNTVMSGMANLAMISAMSAR